MIEFKNNSVYIDGKRLAFNDAAQKLNKKLVVNVKSEIRYTLANFKVQKYPSNEAITINQMKYKVGNYAGKNHLYLMDERGIWKEIYSGDKESCKNIVKYIKENYFKAESVDIDFKRGV